MNHNSFKFNPSFSIFECSNGGMMLIYLLMRIFRVDAEYQICSNRDLTEPYKQDLYRTIASTMIGDYHASQDLINAWIAGQVLHISMCRYDYNLFYKTCNALQAVENALSNMFMVKLNADLSVDIKPFTGRKEHYAGDLKTFNLTNH